MLGNKSPYTVSPVFGMMSKDQVDHDVGRFFEKYVDDNDLDGIDLEDIGHVFFFIHSKISNT